ncbi:MAG: hypothetical protein ACYC36_06085 [Bellilinea sp.]
MSDVINRDELERRLARVIGHEQRAELTALLDILGNPPRIENVPQEFWETGWKQLAAAVEPVIMDIYLGQAEAMLGTVPIGVSWDMINKGAQEYARRYGFDLVKEIMNNTQSGVTDILRALQTEIPNFYEAGVDLGTLTDRLSRWFSPIRAEMIAITETTRAASQAEQAIAAEIERESGIKMIPIWNTENDELVCPLCGPRDQKEITDGMFPPIHPRCLPGDTLVLPIGGVTAGSERWYEGNIITIETLENKLTITPNHPVLTPIGWMAAGLLQEGDYILGYSASQWESLSVNVDDQNPVTTIKNIFGSLSINGFWVPTSAPDFHGDGAGSNIAIIRPNSKIMNDVKALVSQPTSQYFFFFGNIISETALAHPGAQAQFLEGDVSTSTGDMSGLNLARALLGCHARPFDGLGLGLIPGNDTRPDNFIAKSGTANASLTGQSILGFTGDVSVQKIIKVQNTYFTGHVYNLQTETELYVANGIITHNCRCWPTYELPKVKS